MFIGEYSASLDDKSRLAVPVKFREALQGKVVVTRGLDNSLFLFPLAEWQQLAEKLANLPLSQASTRAFSRLMLAGAMDLDVDKQGRLTLPGYLKVFAGIDKKVVVAGLYNRIEIWSESRWEEYKLQTERDSNSIAEQLASLGI
jgi:MraZ protein